MNIALILAGGVGKRAGVGFPKQFLEVQSVPVIVYTLTTFQKSSYIDEIVVVSHQDYIDDVMQYKAKYNISKLRDVVAGGQTGLGSVLNGIRSLSENSPEDIILIHDSVRPFLTSRAIEENVKVAEKHGVAVTSVPCVETLVMVDESGRADTQIPRDNLMRVMTPQSFKLRILRELFVNVDVNNSSYPSTFALYMSKGNPVYCSYGSERNIKITYPEDIDYLQKLFSL